MCVRNPREMRPRQRRSIEPSGAIAENRHTDAGDLHRDSVNLEMDAHFRSVTLGLARPQIASHGARHTVRGHYAWDADVAGGEQADATGTDARALETGEAGLEMTVADGVGRRRDGVEMRRSAARQDAIGRRGRCR